MKTGFSISSLLSLGLLVGLVSATSQAEIVKRNFCVWDPVGSAGPIVTMVKEVKPKALGWGVDLNLLAYTDENIAANDFKAGSCEAVLLTGVTVREFNAFTATLGAVGAIPGDSELKTLLDTLAQPRAEKLMRQGQYEIAGILPIGSVFIYVRDRQVDAVEKFQGKKMAVFDNDPVALTMVRRIGGSVVGASLSNFAGYFNNGSVDIIFAPAVAYETMELYRGIEPSGGILSYPLLHTSMQIVINRNAFPEDFGQQMRTFVHGKFDELLEVVKQAEQSIPDRYWVPIPEARHDEYNEFMRQSRISLMSEGLYDATALKVMKKVRCKHSPSAGECASSEE